MSALTHHLSILQHCVFLLESICDSLFFKVKQRLILDADALVFALLSSFICVAELSRAKCI